MHQLDLYFEPWLQRTCFLLLCTACMRSLDALCVLCSLAFCVVVVDSSVAFLMDRQLIERPMAGSDREVSLSETEEFDRPASENSADYENAKSPLADETMGTCGTRSSEADAKEARSEPEPPQAQPRSCAPRSMTLASDATHGDATQREVASEGKSKSQSSRVDAMMRGNRNSFDAQQREGAAKTAPEQLPEREKARKRKSSHISGAPKQSFAVKLRKISNAAIRRNSSDATSRIMSHTYIDVDQPSWKSGYCVVEGLAILVRSFASVWFPSRQFSFLLEAASKITVRAGPVMLRDIKNFKLAFLHGMEEPQAECNARMREILLQLREIRRIYSGDFTKLSEAKTSDCLWSYARAYVLMPEQLQLCEQKQRGALRRELNKRRVCQHRLRALIKHGWQRFENVSCSRSPSRADLHERYAVMLDQFLEYVKDVETCAYRYQVQ